MANTLGALVVKLGLDAAEFTQGLSRAEFQAQKFAQNTRAAILSVGKVLGGLAIAAEILESTKAIIAEAAALDDLADSTGASVEALSQLNNQAKISGTEFATLQNALLKLSAGMAGTDEETTKAKEALKLLGVTTKDPAEAMQQIAVALDKFEDGVNKVAIAVALFGKGGAQLLPTLKDMAELQDVQATITTKQAKEADELGKAWRRLSAESTTFKNAILNNVVPPLTAMITEMTEGIRIAGGFANALAIFGTINPFQSIAENLADTNARIKALQEDTGAEARWAKALGVSDYILGRLKTRKEFQLFQERQQAMAGAAALGDLSDQVSRSIRKPAAPALPAGGGDRTRALKEQTTEAQRYLESLEKQNERTLELTHTEQFLRDVQLDRIKGLTPAITDQILKQTQLLDSTEALKKAEDERKKAAEEAAKAQERINEATQRAVDAAVHEVESIKAGNDQLREQIAFLQGGDEAVRRLTDAKLADLIATKEAEVAAMRTMEANQLVIAQTEEQITLLKERQALIGQSRFAEQMKQEAASLQEVKNLFANALVDPLTDFVTGTKSAKDAFRDLVNDVTRQLTRIASQNITNVLFGGNSSSGADVFGILAKMAASYFGAPDTYSGPVRQFASGTNYAPGGMAWVGEQGPELVNLPRGSQVIPFDKAKRAGGSVNIVTNITVPGNTSRATADQIGVQVGIAASRALRRNS